MPEKKKSSKEGAELNFEQALAEIESIVSRLESGEIPLDESLLMFQRGMELVNFCSARLDRVEEKLKLLIEGADGNFTLKDAE